MSHFFIHNRRSVHTLHRLQYSFKHFGIHWQSWTTKSCKNKMNDFFGLPEPSNMITLTSLKGTNTFTLYLAKFPTRREGRSSIYKRRQHDHLFISLKYPMCEYTLLDSTTMARLAAYTRPNGAMHRWSLSERMWSHIAKRYFWRRWKVTRVVRCTILKSRVWCESLLRP